MHLIGTYTHTACSAVIIQYYDRMFIAQHTLHTTWFNYDSPLKSMKNYKG